MMQISVEDVEKFRTALQYYKEELRLEKQREENAKREREAERQRQIEADRVVSSKFIVFIAWALFLSWCALSFYDRQILYGGLCVFVSFLFFPLSVDIAVAVFLLFPISFYFWGNWYTFAGYVLLFFVVMFAGNATPPEKTSEQLQNKTATHESEFELNLSNTSSYSDGFGCFVVAVSLLLILYYFWR